MRGFDAVDAPERMAHRNFAGQAAQSLHGNDDAIQSVREVRLCLCHNRRAREHVAAYVQTGEAEHKRRGDEQREHCASSPSHGFMLAITNCFLAQIFRPRPNEHCDAADEEKPMITPDPYRAAANSDCHEQQRPDATCRCKNGRQGSSLFCLHAETLNPLAK